MIDTDRLIAQLAAHAQPVRPLPSPLRRTALWAMLAAAMIAMIAAAYGPRAGLHAELSRPSAMLEWISSIATSLFAAYAAFQISVPGRAAAWQWLPLPPLLLWLGGLGWGCMQDYAQIGREALVVDSDSAECAIAITVTSLPLGMLMLVMVRHAGIIRPAATAMLAALSAAALSAAGVSLHHSGENALMTLLWHLGAVLLLSLVCRLLGRPLFAWIGHAKR